MHHASLLLCLSLAAGPAAAAGLPEPADAPATGAYYQFLLARHLEDAGDIDGALAALTEAARLDPAAPDVPAERAALLARQGRFDEAIGAAEDALDLDANNLSAHRVLGTLYASMVEQAAEEGAERDVFAAKAVEHLEKGRDPQRIDRDPALDLMLGRLYLRAGQPERSVAALRRLVEDEPDAAEAYILLSRAEAAAGRPDRAVDVLEGAAAGNPRLLWALADQYERLQRWEKAASAYERAAAFNPSSSDLKMRWASALLNAQQAPLTSRARDLLKEVVSATPTDGRPLYLLSMAERRLRNFEAAETAARRLTALDPRGWAGPLALALAFEEQRRYTKVVETLAPVVEGIGPDARERMGRDYVTLLAHLGASQLQVGRGEAAIETFEKARDAAGDPAAFDTYLVQAHLVARRFDRAVDLAIAARERRPRDARLAQLAARALTGAGRTDDAIALLRETGESRPENVGLQLLLADVLADAGRADEADAVLAAAERRFPADASVEFQRGAILEKREEFAKAEAAFRAVLARDPLHAGALNYLGYMLAERGTRLDEAVSLIERALRIDPDNGAYLDSLGWAYYQQRRYVQAETHIRRASEQLPANSVIQDHLGDVLMAMGRGEHAIAAWQQALEGDRDSIDVAAIEAKIRRARAALP